MSHCRIGPCYFVYATQRMAYIVASYYIYKTPFNTLTKSPVPSLAWCSPPREDLSSPHSHSLKASQSFCNPILFEIKWQLQAKKRPCRGRFYYSLWSPPPAWGHDRLRSTHPLHYNQRRGPLEDSALCRMSITLATKKGVGVLASQGADLPPPPPSSKCREGRYKYTSPSHWYRRDIAKPNRYHV